MTTSEIRFRSGKRSWTDRERCVVHGKRPLLRKAWKSEFGSWWKCIVYDGNKVNSWSSKKPSLVMARACVFIFQAFQLFSSSVQFCGLSRLPCPCRPESHKRNTCEPASVSCSPCRSILPCSQVREWPIFMCFHFGCPPHYLWLLSAPSHRWSPNYQFFLIV